VADSLTVTVSITPWVLDTDEKVCATFLEFKADGWRGAVIWDELTLKVQLNKNDSHIAAAVGDVVTLIGGTYEVLSQADYDARYKTPA
jgi:hypothetical protein